MAKKEKEIKITRVVVGIGETKNIGNYESIKVYNELEATVQEGDKISEIQEDLRKKVVQLNERDFNNILS